MRLLLGFLLLLAATPAARAQLITPDDLASLERVTAADARLTEAAAAAAVELARLPEETAGLEADIARLQIELEPARAAWQRVYDLNAPDLRDLRGERLPQDLQRMRDEIARAKAPYDVLMAQVAADRERIGVLQDEITRLEGLVADHEEARLLLRAEADRRFVPPALIGLEIAWADAPAGSEPLYRARWEWSGAAPGQGAYVDWLFAALAEAELLLAAADRNALEAERRFLAVSDRWQSQNREYIDQTTYLYIVDSMLAFGGIAVAVFGNLESWPAAMLFEIGDALREYKPWRVYGGSVERRYEVPELSEEVIRLRQQAAASSPEPGSLDDLGSTSALVDPTTAEAFKGAQDDKLAKELRWDAIKSSLEVVYGIITERAAHGTLDRLGPTSAGAFGRLLPALLTGALHDPDDYYRIYRLLGGDAFQTGAELLQSMSVGTPGLFETGLARLQNMRQWKEWGRGATVGIAYEAMKQIALLKIDEARLQIYFGMAVTEIEWFLRRNDYLARMQVKRTLAMARRSLLIELGRVLRERAEVCCERQLSVSVGQGLALGVAEVERRGLTFTLTFDRAVDSAWLTVAVSEVGRWPLLESLPATAASEHVVTLHLPARGADDGDLPGSLEAVAEISGFAWPGLRADADPASVAHLDATMQLRNAEEGPDRSHVVRLVAPVLRILDPPADPRMAVSAVAPCAPMLVAFDAGVPLPLTGTLDFLGIGGAGERFVAKSVGGQRQGEVELTAPAPEGQYLLVLAPDPARPEALVSRAFFVVRPPGEAPRVSCEDAEPVLAHWDISFQRLDGTWRLWKRLTAIAGPAGRPGSVIMYDGDSLQTAPYQLHCDRAGMAFNCVTSLLPDRCDARIEGVHTMTLELDAAGRSLAGSVQYLMSVDKDCNVAPLPYASSQGVVLERVD